MDERSIAKRYARALFSVASEMNRVEEMGEEISVFASPGAEDLVKVLSSPLLSREERSEVVSSFCKAAGSSKEFERFLLVVVRAHRAELLPLMSELYFALVDESCGRARGEMFAPVEVGADVKNRIKDALKRFLGKREIVLEEHTDPDLVAGVKVVVGSMVFDNTLKSRVDWIRESLSLKGL